tara:strand:- start:88 stop:321 length:234 start_codon:yes stop_codon:yes gene_type:complete
MLSKYIEPFPFFMALFVGLMMCYVMTPAPQIVFRHPTPENVDDIIYQDGSDNCYKYEVDEVKCPSNKESIKQHPVDN